MICQILRFAALLVVLLPGFVYANEPDGPGMTITYYGTRTDVSIYIKSAHLPNGRDFPTAGSFGYAKNGLSGGATMGAAPDGRQLPEWIDFEWQEPPYPGLERAPSEREAYIQWGKLVDEQFRTLPVKHQRVMIRDRIPQPVIDEVVRANAHAIPHYGTEKRLEIYFIWTSQGIKLRWHIWHTPKFALQYYSHEGGDDVIPEATTMLATFANTIKAANTVVEPGNRVLRIPQLGRSDFSGSPAFAFTDHPLDSGGLVVTAEHEPAMPDAVIFDWRLFPLHTPRAPGETDAEYKSRVDAIFNALPRKNERIEVRNRIPQEVQDEIAASAREIAADRIANSVIHLYFIWTEDGVKFRWRLWEKRNAGSGTFVREGGDEVSTN